MCGIAGLVKSDQTNNDDIDLIKKMNQIQRHRGPDDEGLFFDDMCVLGHRRLAIIDLSANGHQPFSSDDQRYQMVYNGEIYNYIELREELEQTGDRFCTQTDTEVLLKAYQRYGKECLSKFNGMFAFAIYDTKEKSLFLGRDRVGIKPLYYTLQGSVLYFASEIKALAAIPSLKTSANHQAIFDYFVFNRTDIFDETFTDEIKRLPKGHYAVFEKGKLQIEQWWNPEDYLHRNQGEGIEQIRNRVEELLVSSVQLRMRSDVTVGSCLSGGAGFNNPFRHFIFKK